MGQNPGPPFIVHKFGGSSVADAECFGRVTAIIESDTHARRAVVLSACRGVTDALLELVAQAERQDAWDHNLARIRERHAELAEQLLPAAPRRAYREQLDRDIADIAGILRTTAVVRAASHNIRDVVAGYGEIWSSRALAALLAARGRAGKVQWLDAREVLVVHWGPLGPSVQWADSEARLARQVPDPDRTLVITGYIAVNTRGIPTTLG